MAGLKSRVPFVGALVTVKETGSPSTSAALKVHRSGRRRYERPARRTDVPGLNRRRPLALGRRLSLEITCRSEGSQPAKLWSAGMDHRDVSALADELAQCTCQHLPWSDQRVIALELGVGECDLAIDDMVRAAVHGACPVTRPHHRAVTPMAGRL